MRRVASDAAALPPSHDCCQDCGSAFADDVSPRSEGQRPTKPTNRPPTAPSSARLFMLRSPLGPQAPAVLRPPYCPSQSRRNPHSSPQCRGRASPSRWFGYAQPNPNPKNTWLTGLGRHRKHSSKSSTLYVIWKIADAAAAAAAAAMRLLPRPSASAQTRPDVR